MSDVTRMLSEIAAGNRQAAAELLPLVYDELRRLAGARLLHEQPGQTLQATALVHEVYLRLVGTEGDGERWEGRRHFFAAAAEAMRRILVEEARRKGRLKRGGDFTRLEFDEGLAVDEADDRLVEIDRALQQLATVDRVAAELVNLRFFAGLNNAEAAAALQVSPRTADRIWAYARAWLLREIEGTACKERDDPNFVA